MPSLLALFCWGVWGFLTKAAGDVHWRTMMIFLGASTLIIALTAKPPKMVPDAYHIWGLLSGVACSFGYLFFYKAIEKGQATVVVPITSLYIAISAIFAFMILAEPLTFKKILGILFAIVAVVLLAV